MLASAGTSASPGSSLNSSEEDLNTPANAYPSKGEAEGLVPGRPSACVARLSGDGPSPTLGRGVGCAGGALQRLEVGMSPGVLAGSWKRCGAGSAEAEGGSQRGALFLTREARDCAGMRWQRDGERPARRAWVQSSSGHG